MFCLQILTLGGRYDIADKQIIDLLHKITRIRFCRERATLDIISELRLREILSIQLHKRLVHILRFLIKRLVRGETIIT